MGVLRTWPMLAALGAGLVLIAVGAGVPDALGAASVGCGAAALGWGVLSLRAGRPLAPATTLGVSAALLVATAFGLPVAAAALPRVAASVFLLAIATGCAVSLRRSRATDAPARRARPERAALPGLVVGAVLVAALATPALAATDPDAVPHHAPAGHHSGP